MQKVRCWDGDGGGQEGRYGAVRAAQANARSPLGELGSSLIFQFSFVHMSVVKNILSVSYGPILLGLEE